MHHDAKRLINIITVRLLTHVLCKPTHLFFHSVIATMSYSLQTSFNSVMKDWADKYHVWGTPTHIWNAYVAGNLLKIKKTRKMKHACNKDKTRLIILKPLSKCGFL